MPKPKFQSNLSLRKNLRGKVPTTYASNRNSLSSNLIAMCDVQRLVNLVLHWQTVTVPPSPTRNMMSRLVGVPRHSILDGP